MFPNVDCFIGVKDELSIQESPDTSRGLFSLMRSYAFKFGDEVLETMMVQFSDKRQGFWAVPSHFCCCVELLTEC